MNSSDAKNFASLITGVAEAYGKVASKEMMRVYFTVLSKYSFDQVSEAMNNHLVDTKAGRFFPKPADVILQIESRDADHVDVEAMAELAWNEVYLKISTIGPYKPLEMSDRNALVAVKTLGGWPKLCNSTYEELKWMKKEFIKQYDIMGKTSLEHMGDSLQGITQQVQDRIDSKASLGHLIERATAMVPDDEKVANLGLERPRFADCLDGEEYSCGKCGEKTDYRTDMCQSCISEFVANNGE
jgi:hypothetical protein